MITIPDRLRTAALLEPRRKEWTDGLAATVEDLSRRWDLALEVPFSGAEGTCSWVAPAVLTDGTRAVLKVGWPHMEADGEIDGLVFWNGDPTVRLLRADRSTNAMLLEECRSGQSLRSLSEPDQDVVIGDLLRRLWRRPASSSGFRHLSFMLSLWSDASRVDEQAWSDKALVEAGLGQFEILSAPAATDVVLATDLHAGNVLRAERQPWLVIDPKPFVGDRAYDATQHLLNCRDRLLADPRGTIENFADHCELGAGRVGRWLFARAAAEPRSDWGVESMHLARVLSRNIFS